ncbi:MAM and LDL-receptor class A domain-containing protein 1-like [Elysia marginata]|uniref:MAM and LDL-receptor class A domain-containing protein 1-like n=1 Tax=Elysia marginata TaxID=1093978 RepID=A0AAV4H2H4_9GAST|nr:MAM and LDL-receptor class A domain-containing protein 1-like [Elysia marginata]
MTVNFIFADECKFDHEYCGYMDDDTADYEWHFGYRDNRQMIIGVSGIQPSVVGHSIDEKARLKSPIYAGGGQECLRFTYTMPGAISGLLSVYAQEIGKDLGKALWNMPYLKSLDYNELRSVSLPLFQYNPFQIVFEHRVGVANGNSPVIFESRVLTHPCEPIGSCDFEEDSCSYQLKEWFRFSPRNPSSSMFQMGIYPSMKLLPAVDHTYGVNDGVFLGAYLFRKRVAQLTSPVLHKTSSSCLTLAYALTGSAYLKVYVDVDGIGKTLLATVNDTTDRGQIVQWKEVQTDIVAEQNFVVIIEGKSTQQGRSSASVDDIKILSGSCANQTSTATGAQEQKVPEIMKDLSCNFEDASNEFCNFRRGKEMHGSWMKIQGSSSSPSLNFDHTRSDTKGSFAAMVSNSSSDIAEAELELVASVTTLPGCLSFWYHMSGHTLNTLRVYFQGDSPLWEITNQENVVWKHAQVNLGADNPEDSQDTQGSNNEKEFFMVS